MAVVLARPNSRQTAWHDFKRPQATALPAGLVENPSSPRAAQINALTFFNQLVDQFNEGSHGLTVLLQQ